MSEGVSASAATPAISRAESVAEEIVVAVTAAGEVLVNRQPVGERSIDAIAAALGKAVSGESSEPPVIVINADAKAAHQSVVDVMQAAQRAGLPHITFATQAPAQ